MGGEGQMTASLGRVVLVTFPASCSVLPMVIDGAYLGHVGLVFFDQLFQSVAPELPLVLCRTVETDQEAVVEWIKSPHALADVLRAAPASCLRLHAVVDRGYAASKIYHAIPATSPNYSPEIVAVEPEEDDNGHMTDLDVVDDAPEWTPSRETEPELAASTSVFDKLRTLFTREPSPPKPEAVSSNWWSASTQFFRPAIHESKPQVTSTPPTPEPPKLASSQVISRDRFATDRLSASHHIFIPRMEYTTASDVPSVNDGPSPTVAPATTVLPPAPVAAPAAEPHFFIASSWYKEADRMSASFQHTRLGASRTEVDGSFIWI
ncbi:hypothetical protein SDRG_14790 [Saprolegnia diclina VS20]|uniref:Uncharacterized protein n=1 Tax=Saprolegnia diclina (strain VS20) TaxID=1156394 RepID=T0RD42_SAPDV|nr:hypothetical protein SDRG_14790 [Saprolegnia diclina VS20]EQC27467.1 hypothetical protein SDRG_14790 [Saprolegnia diclina VS20]|eukprot:XP_008619167.1 hypothetical protein SDRG_14790 [Saprolegnia diclina VS20]